jgi:hypothetical protein
MNKYNFILFFNVKTTKIQMLMYLPTSGVQACREHNRLCIECWVLGRVRISQEDMLGMPWVQDISQLGSVGEDMADIPQSCKACCMY